MVTEDPPGGGGGWLVKLLPTRGLTPAELAAVERERLTKNVVRTRASAPFLMVLLLGISLAMLLVTPATDDQARWQRGITIIDLAGALALAATSVLSRGTARTGPGAVFRRQLGEAMTILGVLIGAALVVNTLNYQFKMIAWVAVILLTSVLFHPRGAVFAAVQLGGLVTVLVAAFYATGEGAARLGHTTTAIGSFVCVMVVERITFAAFVRETVMRHQLAEINRDLEHRVTQQVREIVANNERIEALNRQLAGKVASRSEELASALRRLADAEHGGETFAPGTIIGDRVEIKYVVGVGGMGVVYAAVDKLADQRIALKVVRTGQGDIAGGAVRFLQEATATATLSHPAIVRVLHVDVTSDGRLYQALELIEGQTLDQCLQRGRGLPRPIVARLGAVVADALAVAHALGIVHRDVKPQNIMITADAPGCRLLDFGLAKLRETLSHASLSEHGAVIGTPQFLAPEQVSTPLNVTGAADVYALGVVLYLCFSGRLPFQATQPMQWLYAHVHETPRRLTTSATPALVALIDRCLTKDPAQRPDARTIADELTQIADALDAPPLHEWTKTIEYVDTRPLAPLPADLAEVDVPGAPGDRGPVLPRAVPAAITAQMSARLAAAKSPVAGTVRPEPVPSASEGRASEGRVEGRSAAQGKAGTRRANSTNAPPPNASSTPATGSSSNLSAETDADANTMQLVVPEIAPPPAPAAPPSSSSSDHPSSSTAPSPPPGNAQRPLDSPLPPGYKTTPSSRE